MQKLESQIPRQFSDRNVDRCSLMFSQSMRVPFSFPEIDPHAAMCIIKSSSIIKRPVSPRVVTWLIPPRLNGLVPGNGIYTVKAVVCTRNAFPESPSLISRVFRSFSSGQVNKCEREKRRGGCLHVLGSRDASPAEDTPFLSNFLSITRDNISRIYERARAVCFRTFARYLNWSCSSPHPPCNE